MTGQEFYNYLRQKIDKAYSASIDTAKANRLIQESLFRLCDKVYSGTLKQKELDEIWSMVVKEENIPTATSFLDTADFASTYKHLLAIRYVIETELTGFTYSNSRYNLPAHNLRRNDVLSVSGATNPAHNTDYTVTTVGRGYFNIPLVYVDGTITLKQQFWATPYTSDFKKGRSHAPTVEYPKYELVNSSSTRGYNLYPQPTSVYVDYITEPPVPIDATDDTIDLLATYPQRFLYRIADECVVNFADQVRDPEQRQQARQTIIDNP